MNQTDRFLAICGLAKLAQAMPSNKPALSSQEQQRRRAASMALRSRNGEKLLRGEGRNYEPGMLENIGAGASGFIEDLRENGLSNLGSGAASMAIGLAKGISDVPADIVGLGNGIKSLFTDQKFKDAYTAGRDGFNDLTGITRLRSALDKGQQSIFNDYMQRNGIDPANKDDTFGRLGMYGLNIAHGAGYATGAAVGSGVGYRALKGIPSTAKALRNPGSIVNGIKGMPSAVATGAGRAVGKVNSVLGRGAVANTKGIWWKAPTAYGLAALNAQDGQGKNLVDNVTDNANFWNGVRKERASTRSTSNSTDPDVRNMSDADRLAYYINR